MLQNASRWYHIGNVMNIRIGNVMNTHVWHLYNRCWQVCGNNVTGVAYMTQGGHGGDGPSLCSTMHQKKISENFGIVGLPMMIYTRLPMNPRYLTCNIGDHIWPVWHIYHSWQQKGYTLENNCVHSVIRGLLFWKQWGYIYIRFT